MIMNFSSCIPMQSGCRQPKAALSSLKRVAFERVSNRGSPPSLKMLQFNVAATSFEEQKTIPANKGLITFRGFLR